VAAGAIARIFSAVSKWRILQQPGSWIEVGADSVMSVLLFHTVSETCGLEIGGEVLNARYIPLGSEMLRVGLEDLKSMYVFECFW